mmetsp:Transcript_28987/g.60299  ORF Transcript_28987/g.60299 Transcript_28987/m.60299 type:complete len:231 (+) Transcript_28987:1239-1931(+)
MICHFLIQSPLDFFISLVQLHQPQVGDLSIYPIIFSLSVMSNVIKWILRHIPDRHRHNRMLWFICASIVSVTSLTSFCLYCNFLRFIGIHCIPTNTTVIRTICIHRHYQTQLLEHPSKHHIPTVIHLPRHRMLPQNTPGVRTRHHLFRSFQKEHFSTFVHDEEAVSDVHQSSAVCDIDGVIIEWDEEGGGDGGQVGWFSEGEGEEGGWEGVGWENFFGGGFGGVLRQILF